MKLTEETEHPINWAMRAHPEIFTARAKKFEGEAFEEALSRWAREFPEEAAAYEDSIVKKGTLPMEILDHWDAIEEMAAKHPGMDIVEVVYKWMAETATWRAALGHARDEVTGAELERQDAT